ncbi:Ran GTPase binding protein [Aureococcus anophagefferens]|uniref:Ran GTPase binding protein n=1 Tax=Aureococcus anophagefferens TaxID=44056 RepID=A0ABR1FWP7_AURAN
MNPIARPVILQVAEPVAPPQLKAGFHRTAKQPLLRQKTKKLMMVQKSVAAIMQAAKKPVVGRAKSWVSKKQKPSKLVDVFLQFDHDDANALDYAKLEALHRFYGEPLDAHELRDDVDTFGDDYGAIDFAGFVLLARRRQRRGGFRGFEDAAAASDDAAAARREAELDDLLMRAQRADARARARAKRPAQGGRAAVRPPALRPPHVRGHGRAERPQLGAPQRRGQARAEDHAELAYKPEPPRRKRGGRRRVVPV